MDHYKWDNISKTHAWWFTNYDPDFTDYTVFDIDGQHCYQFAAPNQKRDVILRLEYRYDEDGQLLMGSSVNHIRLENIDQIKHHLTSDNYIKLQQMVFCYV